jgi:hypothetical protein
MTETRFPLKIVIFGSEDFFFQVYIEDKVKPRNKKKQREFSFYVDNIFFFL